MEEDFAIHRSLVRTALPHIRFLYVGSWVCSTLPSDAPSRGPPLRFASTSPPSGCAGDLHPLAVEHARHTVARTPARRPGAEGTSGGASGRGSTRGIVGTHL